MFIETRGINLLARRGSAFLLGMVVKSLSIDFGIHSTRKLSKAEMQFCLKIRSLQILRSQNSQSLAVKN